MFDTVWAAALALHNTAAKLPSGQSLLDFNYSNTKISEMIYKEALNVTFFGLTVSGYNYCTIQILCTIINISLIGKSLL